MQICVCRSCVCRRTEVQKKNVLGKAFEDQLTPLAKCQRHSWKRLKHHHMRTRGNSGTSDLLFSTSMCLCGRNMLPMMLRYGGSKNTKTDTQSENGRRLMSAAYVVDQHARTTVMSCSGARVSLFVCLSPFQTSSEDVPVLGWTQWAIPMSFGSSAAKLSVRGRLLESRLSRWCGW